MKAVVQRVKNASVSVGGSICGQCACGLLVYVGVAKGDAESDAEYLAEKAVGLRIFEDADGKMNLSVQETGGSVLAVSQFTLLGDARKGKRPSYGEAAAPDIAKRLYESFMQKIRDRGLRCESGIFQADMEVTYTNDGPITILLDSKKTF
jgi:D-tyrosyl-tRNA(Tyr) deacylase